MSFPVILLLGAGPNIGHGIAKKFASKSYKVAVASRSGGGAAGTDWLGVKVDFTQPSSVKTVFDEVKSKLGTPSVVAYVAYGLTMSSPTDPLSAGYEALGKDLSINTISPFAAMSEAVKGFAELPSSAAKTFIQVGNMQNKMLYPAMVTMGVGKTGTAHSIGCCAEAYKAQGYHFYYVDERTESGQPVMGKIDGEAHGEFVWSLAQQKEQGPWDATFVKGVGYRNFESVTTHD